MIKALRITSIVAVVAAAVLLVYAGVFGVRSNPKVEEFLKQPGAADKFAAEKGRASAKDESQTSPVVKQAVDFARYLNPPPPVASPVASDAASEPAPISPVSAKFNLVGTSYYADRPELSLALIDEPGEGFHWVRQGNTVGRLTIEKVNDGAMTVRDGSRISEMTVTVKEPWRELIKGASTGQPSVPDESQHRIGTMQIIAPPEQTQRAVTVSSASSPDNDVRGQAGKPMPPAAGRPGSRGRQADITALRRAGKTTPLLKTRDPGAITRGPGDEPRAMSHKSPPTPESLETGRRRALEEAKSSQITPQEAKQIEELAQQLKQLETAEQQASAGESNAGPPAPDANSKTPPSRDKK